MSLNSKYTETALLAQSAVSSCLGADKSLWPKPPLSELSPLLSVVSSNYSILHLAHHQAAALHKSSS